MLLWPEGMLVIRNRPVPSLKALRSPIINVTCLRGVPSSLSTWPANAVTPGPAWSGGMDCHFDVARLLIQPIPGIQPSLGGGSPSVAKPNCKKAAVTLLVSAAPENFTE